jgi:hypothetical protein
VAHSWRSTPILAPLRASGGSGCFAVRRCEGREARAVNGSSGSQPVIASRRVAASATDRASGPGVSCSRTSAVTPWRLTRPTVGRIPTRPQKKAGTRIEPPVSVPTPAIARPAATAAAVPLLEPPGSRERS